jgi:hypothetical protein
MCSGPTGAGIALRTFDAASLGARVRAGDDLRTDDFAVIGAGTVLGVGAGAVFP